MSETSPPRRTVLVVEDEEDVREMLRTFLEHRGYRVVEAGDGEAAIEVAGRERPDLIMLDLQLPKLDGVTAAERIRQLPGLERVPILTNSAYGTRGIDLFLRIDTLGVGQTDYLTKPLNLVELDEMIQRLLSAG